MRDLDFCFAMFCLDLRHPNCHACVKEITSMSPNSNPKVSCPRRSLIENLIVLSSIQPQNRLNKRDPTIHLIKYAMDIGEYYR
jgi:hypothetical protein